MNINNMTTSEVTALIFQDAEPWEYVAMPDWIAQQVINMDHLAYYLRDWAFNTLDGE